MPMPSLHKAPELQGQQLGFPFSFLCPRLKQMRTECKLEQILARGVWPAVEYENNNHADINNLLRPISRA